MTWRETKESDRIIENDYGETLDLDSGIMTLSNGHTIQTTESSDAVKEGALKYYNILHGIKE